MDGLGELEPTALPTAKPFVGRTVVMRVDRAAAESPTLGSDLVFMRRLGVRPLLVHETADPESGALLVGRINRMGGEAVAIDGTSASTLILATGAESAEIRKVNTHLLSLLLEQGYIPVFASRGAGVSGAPFELDAEAVAQALAAATQAVRLLFPASAGGVPARDSGIIDELTSSEALALACDDALPADLRRCLTAAALGVRSGVDAAQILDLSAAHAVLVEMLTAQHVGTQVISSVVLAP